MVKKVCDAFEKHPIDVFKYQYTSESGVSRDISIMKKDGKWQEVGVYAGGTSTAYVCDNVATKLYRNNREASNKERAKQEEITKIIDPEGTCNVLGVFLTKPKLLGEREITTFNLNAEGGVANSISGTAHEETAFKGDLSHEKVPRTEIPSVCACLVQGSKTLLANKIYHLDAKLENMAYLGEGKAGHFDIAQSINLNNKDSPIQVRTATL